MRHPPSPRMDALHKMAGAHRSQDRIAIFAGLGPPGAAAVKTAVGRQIIGIDRLSGNRLKTFHIFIQTGNGLKQSNGIGVLRAVKNVFHAPALHDLTGIDNRALVAYVRYDTKIMSNQHHCRSQTVAQILHYVQHLGLNGHI